MEGDENEEGSKVGRCVKVSTSVFGGKLKKEFRGQCPGGKMAYYFDAYLCRRKGYSKYR